MNLSLSGANIYMNLVLNLLQLPSKIIETVAKNKNHNELSYLRIAYMH